MKDFHDEAMPRRHMFGHLLIVCCLHHVVLGGKCAGRLNLAINKPTSQSSTYVSINGFEGVASRAVDGVVNMDYYGCRSCTHTIKENAPWWMVDLQQDYLIREVVIVSRNQRGNHLRDFTIEIGKSLMGDGTLADPVLCAQKTGPQATGTSATYPCTGGDTPGRYVRITLRDDDEYFTLCEVQVYGPNGHVFLIQEGCLSYSTSSVFNNNKKPDYVWFFVHEHRALRVLYIKADGCTRLGLPLIRMYGI